MTTIGTYFVIVFVSYYIKYFLDMLNINNRKNMQYANKRMNELRKIPLKNLEQQKEFIELRYPKRKEKTKITFGIVLNFIIMLLFYAGIFIICLKLFQYFDINFKIWQAIIIIFVGPIIINFLLKKFNLQRNDISVFFRQGGK
jgi:hypothetical protein